MCSITGFMSETGEPQQWLMGGARKLCGFLNIRGCQTHSLTRSAKIRLSESILFQKCQQGQSKAGPGDGSEGWAHALPAGAQESMVP